ncbi:PREDICTED: serine/threonine-protein kinase 19 isoform X2 [Nicotiana attenuata]|uniref:serine/threonine-protein kinase 19 isoform X2 n=1 Tax=Nicotiana attenuata TaxID=49451 RepID=UPI000905D22F|nr:PREDICTED: serine/threonine-protein kinase 19 isoform X2 [Nicotiana attenuata]
MENTSPSTSRKRQRDDEPEPEPEPELELNDAQFVTMEENFNFSDTLVALRMMCAQFPHIEKVSIQPFILRSQIYSSVKDRTQVDRDLEIERVSKRLEAQKEDISVFEWFKEHVIHSKLDPSIGHEELRSLLSLGGKVKEEHISLLINAGLLTRQLIDPNMYWFAIPNIGSVLKGVSQGRKELMSFLNRRKYKEMAMAALEKKRLRLSPLDMRFHLRDLLGSGHLKTVESPTGLVVKVVKD